MPEPEENKDWPEGQMLPSGDMSDIVARSDELDRQILAIPAEHVFTKRTVALAFVIAMIVQLSTFAVMWLSLRETTEAANEASSERIEGQIDHLEAFVAEQEEPATDSEQARDNAITRAVQEVPRIKDILCEAFPGARACVQD